jgi:hypothetical protein
MGLLSALVGDEVPIIAVLGGAEWMRGKCRSVGVVFFHGD